jgi:hypothetical protein
VILSLLAHPVAFVLGCLAIVGFVEVAGKEGWWAFFAFVVVYLLASWFLPWWTRPALLWRYWRAKKQVQAEANQFPTWPTRPD